MSKIQMGPEGRYRVNSSATKSQPLTGVRILTTRAEKQSGGLAKPLHELGAEVIEIPTIEIRPPRSYEPLDSALRNISSYDWLILTSVNGVEALFARLTALNIPASTLAHLQIAAIGPATQREIELHGLKIAVTPEKYIAESVVEALKGKTEGKRVLLVRAKVARDVLPNELRKTSAAVDVVEAYETHVPQNAKERLDQLFANPAARPDIITFTSSSTVTNFLSLLSGEHQEALRTILLASIGPVTSATLISAGFAPQIEAREYTMQGLAAAIAEHVAAQPR
jgi:uroporphyrinogen-III synthase